MMGVAEVSCIYGTSASFKINLLEDTSSNHNAFKLMEEMNYKPLNVMC